MNNTKTFTFTTYTVNGKIASCRPKYELDIDSHSNFPGWMTFDSSFSGGHHLNFDLTGSPNPDPSYTFTLRVLRGDDAEYKSETFTIDFIDCSIDDFSAPAYQPTIDFPQSASSLFANLVAY